MKQNVGSLVSPQSRSRPSLPGWTTQAPAVKWLAPHLPCSSLLLISLLLILLSSSPSPSPSCEQEAAASALSSVLSGHAIWAGIARWQWSGSSRTMVAPEERQCLTTTMTPLRHLETALSRASPHPQQPDPLLAIPPQRLAAVGIHCSLLPSSYLQKGSAAIQSLFAAYPSRLGVPGEKSIPGVLTCHHKPSLFST